MIPKTPKPITSVYVLIYPILSNVAHRNGYSLFLHGSLNRDLDVFLYPWVSNCVPIDVMIKEMVNAINGRIINATPEQRPFNRKSIGIAFELDNKIIKSYYIDLTYVEP